MNLRALIMVLALGIPALARPAPRPGPPVKRVTMDFDRADLVEVCKVLARAMDRRYCIGTGTEGEVSVHLLEVPADAALAIILKMRKTPLEYRLVSENTVVVSTPEKIDLLVEDALHPPPRCHRGWTGLIRQEILLESTPAADLMDELRPRYPEVELIPHPTLNGFYVVGPKDVVLRLKAEATAK